MNPYIAVLRPWQWYKNLVVFLALVFSGNLLNLSLFISASIAFFSFCALASATYVINDYADRKQDALHPEKSKRPIASGKIGLIGVCALALILFGAGILLSFFLPKLFTLAALAYFTLSQLYTFILKHEAFADILAISVNFVIRAAAGAFAISVYVSPWLILGIFFLAMFLVSEKRKGELILLKSKASELRKSLAEYTPELISLLCTISTAALVVSYVLYSIFGEHKLFAITIPFALYLIFKYESLGAKVLRNPHLALLDKKFAYVLMLWLCVTLIALYFPLELIYFLPK